MKNYKLTIQPLGKTIEAPAETPLQDLLFEQGVEFPCGGRGTCKGCRVKVLQGHLPITPRQAKTLTQTEIQQGWRLACQYTLQEDLVVELAQWEMPILADSSSINFTPTAGAGIAIDLGTTTIVAQLIDCQTGHVLSVESALNPQAKYGSDIMSRIQFDQESQNKGVLTTLIRDEILRLIQAIIAKSETAIEIKEVLIAGNTAMHHLFCGLNTAPLAAYPFTPHQSGAQCFTSKSIGWSFPQNLQITVLPNLGGFVGSDLLAGILATRIHESEEITTLLDLGTNGEIIIGNKDKILCASTAAGPAFEGGRIAMGMRASTGAISAVTIENEVLSCQTIGHTIPKGICGSGLLDAVACGLNLGMIQPTGRFADSMNTLNLQDPVHLIQKDIRELQLAKAAIAAGIRILLDELNVTPDQVAKLYLSGAFGNYLNPVNAQRIGLFPFPIEKSSPQEIRH